MNIDITKTSVDNSWFSLSIDDCLDTVLARYAKESRREVFLDDSTVEDIESLSKEGFTYQEIMDKLDIKMHLVRRVLATAKDGETYQEKYNQKKLLSKENNGVEENRKRLKKFMNGVHKSNKNQKKMKVKYHTHLKGNN